MKLQEAEDMLDKIDEIKTDLQYEIMQVIHGLLDLVINESGEHDSRLIERAKQLNIKVMVKLQKYEADNA